MVSGNDFQNRQRKVITVAASRLQTHWRQYVSHKQSKRVALEIERRAATLIQVRVATRRSFPPLTVEVRRLESRACLLGRGQERGVSPLPRQKTLLACLFLGQETQPWGGGGRVAPLQVLV